ncbi:F-box only protein 16 [Cololabis saira]|uniref:F-box only protein 16 n=1 Tax=Cololabis saira TaxID=129043 RepID=UPI002AD48C7A|nr:F-box only protein 16 [Cololabis saira]
MQTKRSAWTPLNHPPTNRKVFEERRRLLAKWFDRWSGGQRKEVLQDLVVSCSAEQLRFLSLAVSRRLPLQAADFTCLLPRAVCLYLFSFLDPRSLCRCAQVSWHWRGVVELDRLWMPRCVKLGWCVDVAPTPFEQGAWKRLYIRSVQELRLHRRQTVSSRQHLTGPGAPGVGAGLKEAARDGEQHPASGLKTQRLPPWRDSDRRPKDTIRFNYLDNLDPIERVPSASSGSSKTPSEATYKLRKAKSLMFLSTPSPPSPPPPAQIHPPRTHGPQNHLIARETAERLLGPAQRNAGIRPRPARTPMPQLSTEALRAFRRSNRSLPSK